MGAVTDSVLLDLPIPERVLHPNARTHWAAKAKAVKQARHDASLTARIVMTGKRMPHWEAAQIAVTPYYRDRRRRDADGLLASLKSAIDGIVDSGLLAGDHDVTYTLHPAQVDRARPHVELTITRRATGR